MVSPLHVINFVLSGHEQVHGKKKNRFMMCNEENATCFFLSPQPCQNMFWSELSISENITDFKFLLK